MRADRLLSILLLLQTRGRMTAAQLARQHEVSERTIYRDVVALSAAGIPIFTEHGPGGGISLIDEYHTDLTGLTSAEASALSMLAIPAPLTRLGVAPDLRTALLKLSAALPARAREQEVLARQRILLDASGWFQAEDETPHLAIIQKATWQDRLLQVTCRSDFGALVQHVIAPYGLAAKADVWHLVAGLAPIEPAPAGLAPTETSPVEPGSTTQGMKSPQASSRDLVVRVWRVSQVVEAQILPDRFARPIDFDLRTFWESWCRQVEDLQPRYEVKARITSSLGIYLHTTRNRQPDEIILPAAVAENQEWTEVSLDFDSFESARTRILGLGGAIEVLEPLALRMSVMDYAARIMGVYGSRND
jgi:predicted DNA-binding transcriptional regulator YafY